MKHKHPVVIGVDVGGTNIEAAAVRRGEVLASKKNKTAADEGANAVVDRIEATVVKVLDELDGDASEVEAICVGATGAVDRSTGAVTSAPNLGWKDMPLGRRLKKRLGRPVLVDNDVNIGLIGEHVFGAGRGALNLVGIFVGTGIKGALIVDGKPYAGFRGAAGELGHMVVQPRGRECPCGRLGCVEAYASKTAMHAMIRENIASGRQSAVPRIMEDKGKGRLTSSVVEKALDADDGPMAEALQSAQYYLGILTANLVNTLDPEVVVFGGGLVERLGEPFLEPVARTARKHYLQQRDAERIRIVPAALGDDAGPVGAAVVAERRLGSR